MQNSYSILGNFFFKKQDPGRKNTFSNYGCLYLNLSMYLTGLQNRRHLLLFPSLVSWSVFVFVFKYLYLYLYLYLHLYLYPYLYLYFHLHWCLQPYCSDLRETRRHLPLPPSLVSSSVTDGDSCISHYLGTSGMS